MGEILVGGVVIAILAWAVMQTRKSIKNNTCPGCSGVCSEQQKKECKSKLL